MPLRRLVQPVSGSVEPVVRAGRAGRANGRAVSRVARQRGLAELGVCGVEIGEVAGQGEAEGKACAERRLCTVNLAAGGVEDRDETRPDGGSHLDVGIIVMEGCCVEGDPSIQKLRLDADFIGIEPFRTKDCGHGRSACGGGVKPGRLIALRVFCIEENIWCRLEVQACSRKQDVVRYIARDQISGRCSATIVNGEVPFFVVEA